MEDQITPPHSQGDCVNNDEQMKAEKPTEASNLSEEKTVEDVSVTELYPEISSNWRMKVRVISSHILAKNEKNFVTFLVMDGEGATIKLFGDAAGVLVPPEQLVGETIVIKGATVLSQNEKYTVPTDSLFELSFKCLEYDECEDKIPITKLENSTRVKKYAVYDRIVTKTAKTGLEYRIVSLKSDQGEITELAIWPSNNKLMEQYEALIQPGKRLLLLGFNESTTQYGKKLHFTGISTFLEQEQCEEDMEKVEEHGESKRLNEMTESDIGQKFVLSLKRSGNSTKDIFYIFMAVNVKDIESDIPTAIRCRVEREEMMQLNSVYLAEGYLIKGERSTDDIYFHVSGAKFVTKDEEKTKAMKILYKKSQLK